MILMNPPIYTIGHSNHQIEVFLDLLRRHEITAVADVRSAPYSRYARQFCRDELRDSLAGAGIEYRFLGKELGARSDNPDCYCEGKVCFDRLAREPGFALGLGRVIESAAARRVALLCAEKDPLDCHRALLVSRALRERGEQVMHILADGSIETHGEMETRLLAACKLPAGDLFSSREEFLERAYAMRGSRVAHQD